MSLPIRNDSTRGLIASQAAAEYLSSDLDEIDAALEDFVVEDERGCALIDYGATTSRLPVRRRFFGAVVPAALSFAYVAAPTTTSQTEFEIANWSVLQGLTIHGLSFDSKTGIISGTPVALGINGATVADRVAVELEKLGPGWAGEGTCAPSEQIIADVETVLDRLPSNTSMPLIEVEEEDGTVALRWIKEDNTSSFALVFQGDGRVTGISATVQPPRSESWSAEASDEIRLATAFEDARTLSAITS